MSIKYMEIIGFVSVVASLIFVGVEINQNTNALRGETQQNVSMQVNDMYKLVAENERIARLISLCFEVISKEDLSDSNYISLWNFQMMGFRRIENIYLQHKNGILKEDGKEITRTFHRHAIDPSDKNPETEAWEDTDISSEDARVQAIANATWTDSVKTAYQEMMDAQTPLGDAQVITE